MGVITHNAMNKVVPVIVTEIGSVVEIVKHGKTGHLVPSGDQTALVAAIVAVMDDRSAAMTMGMVSFSKPRKNFSIHDTGRVGCSVYTWRYSWNERSGN